MRYRTGLLAAVVALAAFVLYLGTLSQGFVADDFIFLHQLRFTQPELADSFAYFGRDWGMGAEFYRPLTRVYWALLHSMAGETAWAWHLVGAVLYSLTALLVFLLVLRLTRNYVVALLAGLFFAVHPAHVETVSWVANSSDLLACLFCLLATLSYIYFRTAEANSRLRQSRRTLAYVVALLSFFAGLLSKESAVGFIVVPLVYDAIFAVKKRVEHAGSTRFLRSVGAWVARQLPFLGVLAVYLWLRWNALGGLGGYVSSPGDAPTFGAFIEVYARWLILPLVLNRTLLWLIFIVVIVVLVGTLVYWERRAEGALSQSDNTEDVESSRVFLPAYPLVRAGVFGVLWVALFLLPTVTTPPSMRFVYISSVGVAMVWAVLLSPFFMLFSGVVGRVTLSKRLGKFPIWQIASWMKVGLAGALLLFSALDSLPRLGAWQRAGESSRDILADIRAGRPEPADYTPVYAAGLPQANEEALIFRTGFPEAIQLLYDNTTVQGLPVTAFPVVEQRLNEAYFVEYREGHIVPRDDVVAALQERNKQVKAKSEQPFQVWDFVTRGANPGSWERLSGDGTVEARSEGLEVNLPSGGFVRPPMFSLEAPALSWFEFEVRGIPSTPGQTGAQLVVHWVVGTPGGPVERASAPVVIALDGESHIYRVKPPDMSVFFIDDIVTEVRVELPPGIALLTVEKASLFKLPWK